MCACESRSKQKSAGEPIVVLLSKRRVYPGRVCGLCAYPTGRCRCWLSPCPGREANRCAVEQAQDLSRPGGIAAGYPPTPAGKPIAVLLSKRRVLEKSGVPSPGRVVSLLAIPLPRPGTVAMLLSKCRVCPAGGVAGVLTRPGGIAAGYPPTPAGDCRDVVEQAPGA